MYGHTEKFENIKCWKEANDKILAMICNVVLTTTLDEEIDC